MAIVPYTGDTTRLDTPTEPLTPPRDYRTAIQITAYIVFVLLVLGACPLVVRVNNEAFTVGAAVLLAGYFAIAFNGGK